MKRDCHSIQSSENVPLHWGANGSHWVESVHCVYSSNVIWNLAKATTSTLARDPAMKAYIYIYIFSLSRRTWPRWQYLLSSALQYVILKTTGQDFQFNVSIWLGKKRVKIFSKKSLQILNLNDKCQHVQTTRMHEKAVHGQIALALLRPLTQWFGKPMYHFSPPFYFFFGLAWVPWSNTYNGRAVEETRCNLDSKQACRHFSTRKFRIEKAQFDFCWYPKSYFIL